MTEMCDQLADTNGRDQLDLTIDPTCRDLIARAKGTWVSELSR